MPSFIDLPGILPEFVTMNRSRASGAGLDLFEYDRVTAALTSLRDWPAAFHETGLRHHAAADTYDKAGHAISAGEEYRTAARWFHTAVLLPHPDHALATRAATDADDAMSRALTHLDPTAERLDGSSFVGWLRRPVTEHGRPPIVVVIPGLDSSKEEFHDLIDALLRRGVAVFAMDGPGQGVLAATSTVQADYQRVLTKVVNALETREDLDAARLGVIGLSLGGYYAAVSAAHEPRIKAAATVSGPYHLTWNELPPFVTETLIQRAGSTDAARSFTAEVDLRQAAGQITCPLRVIDGGLDIIPGFVNGAALARHAPHGEYLLVPQGDHLLGNVRADWLPSTTDWLVDHLI